MIVISYFIVSLYSIDVNTIILLIIIIIIVTSLEFFTSTLADGLLLEFEW